MGQRFTPLLVDAARPCRHAVGDRWQVDETYLKVAGQWRYVYRAIDQFGQVIDVFMSPRRDTAAARPVLPTRHRHDEVTAIEVTTDRAAAYPAALDDLLPATWHRTDQHANNRIECDHGRLKARLRSMRGLKQDRSATVVLSGHALVQNLRRALRARGRGASKPSRCRRVRRAGSGDLIPLLATASACHPSTRCNRARGRVPVGYDPIRAEDDPNGHRAKDNSRAGP